MTLREFELDYFAASEKARLATAKEYAGELKAEISWLDEDTLAEWIEVELTDAVGDPRKAVKRDCLNNLLGRAIKEYERALHYAAAKEGVEIE